MSFKLMNGNSTNSGLLPGTGTGLATRASESELMASDEPPTPEIQLQFKIDSRVNDSLESTRRMKRMMEESRTAGAASLASLHQQGQQLDRIETDLEHVSSNIDRSAKVVTQMERSCWYDLCRCCCCCCSSKGKEEEEGSGEGGVVWKKDGNSVHVVRPPTSSGGSALDRSYADYTSGYSLASSFSGGLIERVTSDFREDEMEDNLQDVNHVIHALRHMALDQGSTIDQQNQQIDRINESTERNQVKMTVVNKRMEDLLK